MAIAAHRIEDDPLEPRPCTDCGGMRKLGPRATGTME